MKLLLVCAAFAAATFFALLAALTVTLGDVQLIPASLTAGWAGLLIWAWPVGVWPPTPPPRS